MLLYYYEEVYHKAPNYDANIAIVMLTLVAADLCSWSVGADHSRTIRDLPAHPAIKVFYSFMQFGGTAACLWGLRRYSMMLYFCFVMQVNSFLMTLRRKNLVSKPLNMFLYGSMLFGGFIMSEYELRSFQDMTFNGIMCRDMIMHGAGLLRLGPRLPVLRYIQDNKYLLWLMIGLVLRKYRYLFDDEPTREMFLLRYVLIALVVMMFVWKGFLADKLKVVATKKSV